jgi:hypothetical protein
MICSSACLLVRRLLGCLALLARRDASKDAGLLVLRHEKQYCAGKPAGSAASRPIGSGSRTCPG